MPKNKRMKDLLRRLHIGGSGAATISPNQSPIPDPNLTCSSDRDARESFNVVEEDFQMQMALAISASHSHSSYADSVDSAQMDAAKQMSLGCAAASLSHDTKALLHFQSLRYWNYNVLGYEEKVMDGFYDVYGINSNFIKQGKMPMLVDLEAKLISDKGGYEVILVNRTVDPELQQLEEKASALSNECSVSEKGLISSGLLQRLADIVVARMGGQVVNADKMAERWATRSHEIQDSLNTIVLPLGCLDVGLSRHRALLFKVLANRINIPCMLVKGSYYAGSDDGALNLIKADDGSEYILDLMGAPGALIPVEVPSSQLQNYSVAVKSCKEVVGLPNRTHLMLGDETGVLGISSDVDKISTQVRFPSEELLNMGGQTEPVENIHAGIDETKRFGHNLGSLLQSLHTSSERSSHTEASPAEKIRVNNVSKYVLSAAKNPEFAQKLHTVLLESGALPPPDLFSDVNPQEVDEDKICGKVVSDTFQADPDTLLSSYENSLIPFQRELSARDTWLEQDDCDNTRKEPDVIAVDCVSVNPHNMCKEQILQSSLPKAAVSCKTQNGFDFSCDNDNENGVNGAECVLYSHKSEEVLGERKEWEVQWEDLRIGRRIGIGSYGEVYHAECNGTEVAVKKFLDQDLSGDAVAQFKSEVEIMLRLRHPNVVLFMGAITRPPHLSILTEFLPRGSLYGLLRRPNFRLDDKRRLRMALDVAKGMNCLHTSHPPVVHRDLKSPNLLVDKNWVLKVCDFGLSRMKHHTFLSSKSIAGTPEWMAPEILRNEPANEMCDVFSFGVILWELATTRIPWHGLNPMQVVGAVGFQHRRLEIPEDVDPEVAQIIRDCWQVEPHLRPSFSQLLDRLSRLRHVMKTSPRH